MSELSHSLVTFELGSATEAADHYNIREVYNRADQFTPVIFVLPTEMQGPAWDATQGQILCHYAYSLRWLNVDGENTKFVVK
jgi:hypothetical protein